MVTDMLLQDIIQITEAKKRRTPLVADGEGRSSSARDFVQKHLGQNRGGGHIDKKGKKAPRNRQKTAWQHENRSHS